VAQLYPRALGSLYSQGYGGGILTLYQPGGPGPRTYIPQEQGGPVIPPGTGWPSYTPGHWVPFTRRATVEVF
jgi:hypothetical protein